MNQRAWHQRQTLPGYHVACSRDGSTIITGTPEGCLRIFVRDHDGMWQQKSEAFDTGEAFRSLACNGDASIIITGSEKYLRIFSWDGKQIQQLFEYADSIETVSCSEDGNLIVACTRPIEKNKDEYNSGYAFNYEQGQWHKVWSYTFQDYGNNPMYIMCSGDGKHIVVGSWGKENTLHVFEQEHGTWYQKATTQETGNNTFWSMTTNHNSSIIITGQVVDLTADVFAYDGTKITTVATLKLATALASVDVTCNHDASIIAVGGGSDGLLAFYMRKDDYIWEQKAVFTLPSHVDFLACNDKGSVIIAGVGGDNHAVYIFEETPLKNSI